MKKIISLLLLLPFLVATFAAPARKTTIVHKQSDGTELFLTIAGDEFFHYYTTIDNIPIVKGDNGDYYYATMNDEGNLVATSCMAHNKEVRNFEELSIIAANEFSSLQKSINTVRRSRAAKYSQARSSAIVSTGVANVPVLLVEYQDVKFTFSKEDISDLLNKENYEGYENPIAKSIGSAKDYFIAQSDGKFIPNFIVTDIVTLPKEMSYYGGNNSSGGDSRPGQMIVDGLAAADANFDFSIFDNNGDGEVEFVYCIYAGYGENVSGNPENTIWPHQWDLSSATGKKITHDGVKCNIYACSSELEMNEEWSEAQGGKYLSGIGTMCHEFSHCLGLPDFYDTSSNESGLSTFGYWDIMDYGCYVADGYMPIGYSAYERDFLGWRTLETLSEKGVYSMNTMSNNGKGYKIVNDANSNEYYVLEARKRESWDTYIFNSGMLITHVDYLKSAWDNNTVNNNKDHLRCSLVAADNDFLINATSIAADVWPGTTGKTEFTDTTDPASIVFTGDALGKPITNIRYKNGIVYFSFMYDYKFDTVDGVNILVEYLGSDTDIVLPEDFYGEEYEIGANLFKDNTSITSVVIPENVTSIGDYAFSGCTSLVGVTSNAVIAPTLGTDAFANIAENAKLDYPADSDYSSWSEYFSIKSFILGDINDDGEVNVGDFASLVNLIFNSNTIDADTMAVADINGDGEVNVGDFASLVNLIFSSDSSK